MPTSTQSPIRRTYFTISASSSNQSDSVIYKAAAKRPAAAATPIGRAKAVGAEAALLDPVASAAAELAAAEMLAMPLLKAPLALDAAPPRPVDVAVEEPVAVAEPEQPACVGRFVTPTGEQICWANWMISVRTID